jgi:hypothetical protein
VHSTALVFVVGTLGLALLISAHGDDLVARRRFAPPRPPESRVVPLRYRAPARPRVRRIVRGADVALCHVETPMAPGPPAGHPRFTTPPALARGIRATGFDVCSTASNHRVDRGQPGVRSTLRALDRASCPAGTGDGPIALVDLVAQRPRAGAAGPLRPDDRPQRRPAGAAVGRAHRGGWLDRAALRASWRRTTSVAGRRRGRVVPVPRRLR